MLLFHVSHVNQEREILISPFFAVKSRFDTPCDVLCDTISRLKFFRFRIVFSFSLRNQLDNLLKTCEIPKKDVTGL